MSSGSVSSTGAEVSLQTKSGSVLIYKLSKLAERGLGDISRLPFSIKILLESALRNLDGFQVTEADVARLASWNAAKPEPVEIPFKPARVILQDFTGVPSMVDLAAMRSAMQRLGGDPQKINPQVPCDLVIDHSVQVDVFGSAAALEINRAKEFERNIERYQFLKWGQRALANFRVVPPATGIVHQVNLEYLAQVVLTTPPRPPLLRGGQHVAFPDSLVGTDSHTTMINGLGVVGWGVGGIEAEAVMLGQPIYMLAPQVVGFKITGQLPEGTTATDLVLTVTQMLRKTGVVGQFVEFFGPGLASMSLPDRATIANMAPEYGATMGIFPVDQVTIDYLRMTGREENTIDLVERYCKEQGLWRSDQIDPSFTRTVELDLSTIEPCMAGPKRPQDRVALSGMKSQWRLDLTNTFGKSSATKGSTVNSLENEGGPVVADTAIAVADEGLDGVEVEYNNHQFRLKHGAVVIAAITSCTNTSNPSVMLAAGLLAKKAVEKGLTSKPWVKTSLAPGSRVVTEYLNRAGLTPFLDQLGFNLVGYGCTTCIGNSGPLPEPISAAIHEGDLVASAVLSGNRNFEGRINPDIKANYLASPPLVVAYALAGTADINMTTEPLGEDRSGHPVYLKDIWPSQQEIRQTIASAVGSDQFRSKYADVFTGDEEWQAVKLAGGELYDWDPSSTYIQEPPFFEGMSPEPSPIQPIRNARCLAVLGDSVTTDHISPAGSIKPASPAGKYLIEQGVQPIDFNSYGARRGNDRVMTRGTFANIRLKNLLAPGTEGGVTIYLGPSEPEALARENPPLTKGGQGGVRTSTTPPSVMSIYDAAMKYKEEATPLIILAGKEYGTGSSRDWAAKGTMLLGVRAVIAESYERIHRSNLVGMGVLPLQFREGQNRETLGLTGHEIFTINGLDDSLQPLQFLTITATHPDGSTIEFTAICRIDTPVEIEYYRHGGILHTVLRKMLMPS